MIRIPAFFLCDRVENVFERTNVYSVGVDQISSDCFPTPPRAVGLVLLMDADATEIDKDHVIDIRLRDADGKEQLKLTFKPVFCLQTLSQTYAKNITISSRRPERYQFVVAVDGVLHQNEIALTFVRGPAA